ncbi:MAG TPA: YdeI/OmpD-associated family protein [Bacteroidales bacterium]
MATFNIEEISFFASPEEFRSWLERHYSRMSELWVGYYKRNTGKPSITWPESVDQALCFGWIDGIRKSIDENRYTIRFTPRNPKSMWSAVNVKRVEELSGKGLMHESGLKAFETRDVKKTELYSFEQSQVRFTTEFETKFKKNEKAWNFFQSQAPSYKKTATWWVISAKQEETRLKRLETLMKDSETGQKIAPLRRPARS